MHGDMLEQRKVTRPNGGYLIFRYRQEMFFRLYRGNGAAFEREFGEFDRVGFCH